MKSKAVFFTKDGRAEVRVINVPDPKPNEVQVKTIANGICMLDVWNFKTRNYIEDYIPGHEGIGIITKVGKNVQGAKEGDFVPTWPWSEYTNNNMDVLKKFTCSMDRSSYHIAEPLSCAVNAFSQTSLYPGDKVILFGMGYMGLLLLQLLSNYPLHSITVVDVKPFNLQMAKNFGANEIINSATPEGQERLKELHDQPFDVAYECSGVASALDWCSKLLNEGCTLGIYAWHHDARLVDTSSWHIKGFKVLNFSPPITKNERIFRNYEAADKIMTTQKIKQDSLITHQYFFEDIEMAMKESVLRPDGFIKSILTF